MTKSCFEYANQLAKQRSIELLKFVEQSGLTYRKTHEKWEKWVKEGYSTQVLHEYTAEQIIEQFSKQNESNG